MIWLVACVIVIAVCSVMQYEIRRDFGKIDVQTVRVLDPADNAVLAGRLYRPAGMQPGQKLPGILNMHGYENDNDVNSSFSIELARRGFVVLAIDALGHGDSGPGMDFPRYSNDPNYTCGWNAAYQYVKGLPFVDAANIGMLGHSLGAQTALKVAALNPDHRALDVIGGDPGVPANHNLLLTQAQFDEFPRQRQWELRTDNLPNNAAREKAFGRTAPIAWDTTYGNFADGTARRATLVPGEHRFVTLQGKAVAEAVDWMRLSLKGGNKDSLWLDPNNRIYPWKDFFGLIALIAALLSVFPFAGILLDTPYFAQIAKPVSTKGVSGPGRWWTFATINALIGGILYIPLISVTGLNDQVEGVVPFLRMPIGNGLFLWFTVNTVIAAIAFWFWYRTSGKTAGLNMEELGATISRSALWRTVLLGALLFGWMYALVGIAQWTLGEEFRFVLPFMRQWSGPERLGYFFIYLIPALAFFLVTGGLFLFGMIRQAPARSPATTQTIWWLKNVYAGLLGLFLLWAIQYVPYFFFGTGPIFEQLGWLKPFGPPQNTALWLGRLLVYVPEFTVLMFFLTWFYRKTGRIYLGALFVSTLAIWMLTATTVVNH